MALVLTRGPGEAVVLAVDGHRIRVEVTRVEGGQVRLSFEAPDSVAIWREEVIASDDDTT